MGRRESGQTWTLRLHGGHCLVVGASDAGKGSFVQSFMRSVAGGIAAGTVRVVGFDPKGGMEMAGVAPLLARFLCDGAAEMADALEEEVTVLNERTVALRGRTRQHVATVEEPKRIILIDELATLTAYGDKKTTDRVKAALALILTKGRAAGIHVVALVQDGRKEVVPLRNLFAIRVGLRMVEPAEVDLVLGENARDRGALCDLIPAPCRVWATWSTATPTPNASASATRPTPTSPLWSPTTPPPTPDRSTDHEHRHSWSRLVALRRAAGRRHLRGRQRRPLLHPPAGAPADWQPMPGAVVGSIVWPVILFVAIEILVRVAWPLGRQWAVLRFGGMIPVALVAGVVSYRHLSSLLTYYGEDRLVSALGPLAIDGLMIMATGALLVIGHRTSTPVQDASPTPEPVPDARRRPQDVPAPSPTSLPVPDERSPHVPAVPQRPGRPGRPGG
ncbi:FtsK/SpoIIIE domain-containing protein [Catellatospora coxensis]